MTLPALLSSKILLLLVPIFAVAAFVLVPTLVQSQAGTDSCLQGYVWREAFANDHVCVTPETRQQAADDNAQAGSRIDSSGSYGPDSCVRGYVWREASPMDHVCVTPQVRRQTALENAQAENRHLSTPPSSIRRRPDSIIVVPRRPLTVATHDASQEAPSAPIQPTPCDVVTMGEISEDGSVDVEIRHPDGVIERKTEAGTTTTYPDGHTEFRRRVVVWISGQTPDPPLLASDSDALQKWREYHAASLLSIFQSLSKNEQGPLRKLTDGEANMTLYQKINHRTKIIQSFLARQ